MVRRYWSDTFGVLRLILLPAVPERHNRQVRYLLFAEPRHRHVREKPKRRPTLDDVLAARAEQFDMLYQELRKLAKSRDALSRFAENDDA